MALEVKDQWDFFRQVQLDDDGNLLVSIVNFTGGTTGGTGANYYTTGATFTDNTIHFDRNDLIDAYSVNLSALTITGDYLPLSGGTLTGNLGIDANLRVSGFTTNIFEGGDSLTISPLSIADAGGASTIGYEYNLDAGYCGGAPAPGGNHPYKTHLLSSGNEYTFVGEVNVVSISNLTEPINVYLPTYPHRDFYVVKDKTGNAGLFPITVSSSGNTINGETNFIINISTKPSLTFLWDGEGWITI